MIRFVSRDRPDNDYRFGYLWRQVISYNAELQNVIYVNQHNKIKSQEKLNGKQGGESLPTKGYKWAFYKTKGLFSLAKEVQVIISNNADYQYLTILDRIIFGNRFLYDAQENLVANTIWNGKRKGMQQWLFRLLSWVLNKGVKKADGAIMAERCYLHELPLSFRKPVSLFENLPPSGVPQKENEFKHTILLAGTFGRHYGTLKALDFLSKSGLQTEVKLVGYAPEKTFRKSLEETLNSFQTSSNTVAVFIPPEKIVEAIQNCKVLVLPYEINPATRDRIPTKLYQAIRNNTPILYTSNPSWNRLLSKEPLAFAIDWDYQNISQREEVLQWLSDLDSSSHTFSESLHEKIELRYTLGLARTSLLI